MALIAAYGLGLTLMCAAGSFLLGRLTVRINRMNSLVGRGLLYFGVALVASFIAIAPAFYVAFRFFDEAGVFREQHAASGLYKLVLSLSYLFYYAVLYLSYRAGTGRVHGMG